MRGDGATNSLYDIADEARRNRLSKALKDFGRRIQESVFLTDLFFHGGPGSPSA